MKIDSNKGKPVDTSPFRHLYPFKSHYLDRNGLNYHYLDEGRGAPVVMVHGNPTWSFYYRNLITALSPAYRTIVPDHMGCGLSDKPDTTAYDFRLQSRVADLEALLDHLGLHENLTLIVHDWGGMIGMAFAVKHPERIRRLVILNTAAFLRPDGKKLPLRLKLIRDFTRFATPAVLGLNLFARGALVMAVRKRLPRPVRLGLIAPYNCPQNRIATLKFVQDIPLAPQDPSYNLVQKTDDKLKTLVHVPMLICWGKWDFVFDMDYFAQWRQRFPDAETRVFPNAGHYILEDATDSVVKTIKTFVEK